MLESNERQLFPVGLKLLKLALSFPTFSQFFIGAKSVNVMFLFFVLQY